MEEYVQPAALELNEASVDFLSGAVAGSCGVISGQPLDTLRIRQQQITTPGSTNVLSVFRSTVGLEGTRSLFKGMLYPLFTAAFQNAVVFHAYGVACRHLHHLTNVDDDDNDDDYSSPSLSHIFWAGCFAGAIQTSIVTPVDLLKIRLQLQRALPGTPGYVGAVELLKRTVAMEGIRGLYRGLCITAIRDIPSHGVYFAAFAATKRWLEPHVRKEEGNSPAMVWAAGGLAGAVSWQSVYAFDIIKSRIQSGMYSGIWECAWNSYKREGFKVFFRGMPVTLARAFVVNGAIFSAFEGSRKLMKPISQKKAAQAK